MILSTLGLFKWTFFFFCTLPKNGLNAYRLSPNQHHSGKHSSSPNSHQSPSPTRHEGEFTNNNVNHHDIPSLRNSIPISNVEQLQTAVLYQGHALSHIDTSQIQFSREDIPLSHDVLQLIARRLEQNSMPHNRTDSHHLALAIEGGGMRGAVSAGMAAAIAGLGLLNAFDSIYGSSAGSIVGTYMISRQFNVDVYTNILPRAPKGQFVSIPRLVKSCLYRALEREWNITLSFNKTITPGMNLSYVLDEIMHPQTGLRPLDLKAFFTNDSRHQKLKVVTSAVSNNGQLISHCFGSDDFKSLTTNDEKRRSGLFACLEASMSVPGATGPPIDITSPSFNGTAFDAFCFEPLPYRSAVYEGNATHVMVLRSRPNHHVPSTKPTLYELKIAPHYFSSHGLDQVARFFQRGGQQFLYLQDYLTLEKGRKGDVPIAIPSNQIMYGLDENLSTAPPHEQTTKHAYVLPLTVPHETPELSTLEQRSEKVREAVRQGFAAAYDLLAPLVLLQDDSEDEESEERQIPRGYDIALRVFPTLQQQSLKGIRKGGATIQHYPDETTTTKHDYQSSRQQSSSSAQFVGWGGNLRRAFGGMSSLFHSQARDNKEDDNDDIGDEIQNVLDQDPSLIHYLPGISRLPGLAKSLFTL